MKGILDFVFDPKGGGKAYSDIILSPTIPETWLWIAVACCLLLASYSIAFRIKGSVLRLVIALFIIACLANPILVQEKRESQKDIALLFIDDSPSQNISNRTQQLQQAEEIIDQHAQHLKNEIEVKTVRLSEVNHGSKHLGRSDLLAALKKSINDIPTAQLAASIIITDGLGHDLPTRDMLDKTNPKYLNAPIHVLLTGSDQEVDRRVSIVDAPTYGLVGEDSQLSFIVEQQASPSAPQYAQVTIEADGQRPKRMNVPVGEKQIVSLPLERRGRMTVAVTVDAIPNEISQSNNEVALSINAVRDRLRVLLVSGVPHPGERTWRNLLKSDPSVDLVHFTILRPPEKQDDTPVQELSLIAFPTRELFQTKLHEFDLVVFDRYRRRGVLPSIYLRNIVKYVEQGGALLEIGGPSYASPYSLYRTALGDILPGEPNGSITQQPFKPQLTEDGLRHPVTARLPKGPLVALNDDVRWGRWLRQINVDAVGGDILMKGVDEHPLLVLDRVKKGRVAQLFSDQIWLWARGYEGGGPYAELIRRLSHWLMKEPELEENDLKAEIKGNRLFVKMRSLVPLEAIVKVRGPDGVAFDLPLRHLSNGRYEGEKKLPSPGLYHVDNGNEEILASQDQGQVLEWQKLTASSIPLSPLVNASNGSSRYIEDGLPDLKKISSTRNTSGHDWIGLKNNHAFTITGVTFVNLLDGAIAAILAGFLILLCWRRESR